MYFIAMNLICKFKLSSQGHQYHLTVIDTLMNYTCCILLYTKDGDEVMHVYLVNVYSKICQITKDFINDTKLKNKLCYVISLECNNTDVVYNYAFLTAYVEVCI